MTDVAGRRAAAVTDGAGGEPGRGPYAARVTDVERRLAAARTDPGLVVLEGFHALKHALRFGADVLVAATADRDGLAALAAELAPDLDLGPVEAVPPATLGPRPHHTRVVAVARRPAFDPASLPHGRIVVLEDPRHLGNVGAVVRVAAAAGAAAVLTTGSRDPWDPAALRGSAGLHFALPVGRVDPEALRDRLLVALDPDGEPLAALPEHAFVAFGTERHGLSDPLLARAAARVAIPMRPGVSSLNLATAVAVALYAAR
jgi:TrmH family RNA methyltransferase